MEERKLANAYRLGFALAILLTAATTLVPIGIWIFAGSDWYISYVDYLSWSYFGRLIFVVGALQLLFFLSFIFIRSMKSFLRYEYLKLKWVFRIQNTIVMLSLASLAEILFMYSQYF